MIIPARFNGPPGSANGGYTAGLLASRVPGGADGVEVTLRRPPPLDTPLTVRDDTVPLLGEDGYRVENVQVPVVRAYHGATLIAEATRNAVSDDEIVPAVPFDVASEVSRSYPGFAEHPFPTCFVCGPGRPPGDGLGLYPGRLPDGRTAAPFVIPEDMSAVLVWASLDCPGGWSVGMDARPYVLGRITARVDAVPAPGDRCVVMGELLSEKGRQAYVRSSLYSPAGALLATARAVWFAIETRD